MPYNLNHLAQEVKRPRVGDGDAAANDSMAVEGGSCGFRRATTDQPAFHIGAGYLPCVANARYVANAILNEVPIIQVWTMSPRRSVAL